MARIKALPNQSKRFVEKARELGCDEDPEAFERTFSKVVPSKRPLPPKGARSTPKTKGPKG
jgi:hypothetical protein